MGLNETIKEYEDLANAEMDQLLGEPLEFDSVYSHMRNYVLYRFVLFGDDPGDDEIAVLSDISVRKMLKMQREEHLEEMGLTCTGTSSISMKKVLLMIAIRKKLGFMWNPAESAAVETITQLTERVIFHLNEIRQQ